jgi:hypothetical protein
VSAELSAGVSAPPRGSGPAPRTVLAGVVALQLIAETALTPYWPGLLRDLFGAEDLAATGAYLTVCRVAGLLALPLWGLAARRWPVPRLLVVGLAGAAVCDLTLALAPSLWLFTLASAGSVAMGSVLVLAYPVLVEVLDRTVHGQGSRSDRITAVVIYSAVFHAAAVLATLVGAAIVALPEPRVGLLGFAVADLAAAVLVWRAVPAPNPVVRSGAPALPSGTRVRHPAVAALVLVAALAVLVDVGTGVGRPFFLELVRSEGGSLATGAVLFLLPSVAALAVLPWAARWARARGDLLVPAAMACAGGLALQAAAAGSVPLLGAGRLLFGAGLGLAAIALDLRIFAVTGTGGPAFAAVETARSGALLAAPPLATAAAMGGLAVPLAVGAGLFVLAALLARAQSAPRPSPGPADHSRSARPIPTEVSS